jgi:hypothetical protein
MTLKYRTRCLLRAFGRTNDALPADRAHRARRLREQKRRFGSIVMRAEIASYGR